MTVTILTLCGLCSALTACSSNENTPETDNNPLATQLNGCWWSQHDVGGTVTVDGGTTKTYAKKLLVCRFGADGKAEWMKLLLDKDGGIVKAYGAITTYDEDGKVLNEMPDILHYTSTADGAITMQTASALPGLPNSWQLKYQNGIISGTDDGTDTGGQAFDCFQKRSKTFPSVLPRWASGPRRWQPRCRQAPSSPVGGLS